MPDTFDPRKEVPLPELCIRLKELGYPQDGEGWSGWYWKGDNLILLWGDKFDFTGLVKAPTVRELGEWLPDVIIVGTSPNIVGYYLYFAKNRWRYWYVNKYGEWLNTKFIEADTEANARAKMLIWLVENGYVKFE